MVARARDSCEEARSSSREEKGIGCGSVCNLIPGTYYLVDDSFF